MVRLLYTLTFAALAVAQRVCPADSPESVALKTINPLRANCGAQPLSWSAEIAEWAQAAADNCGGHGYRLPNGKHFVNNFMGGGSLDKVPLAQAFQSSISGWYREWPRYDAGGFWDQPDPVEICGGTMSFAGGDWGHFTLVAWKNATKMGCGRAICPNKKGKLVGVVYCGFDKGNGRGSFDQNVQKPKDVTMGNPVKLD